jgi:hypothetical protein
MGAVRRSRHCPSQRRRIVWDFEDFEARERYRYRIGFKRVIHHR